LNCETSGTDSPVADADLADVGRSIVQASLA
jgi:hypothetical protein